MALSLGVVCPASAQRVHGITLSTHTDGSDWGGPGLDAALDSLVGLGVDWIAYHPYARILGDGTVRFRSIDPARPPEWLRRPIEAAHARGLRVLVKPHLGYWGSRFAWRGEIDFEQPRDLDRFFSSYSRWVLAIAAATRDADALCIGTELDRLTTHQNRWRSLIAALREQTDLPLTYAANWTDFDRVPFWDALDVIGVQAYFPVSDGERPGLEELRAGWKTILSRVRAIARQWTRPVVFTELGYNRSFLAAARPWEHAVDGPEAEAFQALCLRVALESIEATPEVLGAFLWKWFPEPHPVGRNFQLATPRLKRTIAAVWSAPETPVGGKTGGSDGGNAFPR